MIFQQRDLGNEFCSAVFTWQWSCLCFHALLRWSAAVSEISRFSLMVCSSFWEIPRGLSGLGSPGSSQHCRVLFTVPPCSQTETPKEICSTEQSSLHLPIVTPDLMCRWRVGSENGVGELCSTHFSLWSDKITKRQRKPTEILLAVSEHFRIWYEQGTAYPPPLEELWEPQVPWNTATNSWFSETGGIFSP